MILTPIKENEKVMNIRDMNIDDIKRVIDLYINYYNEIEKSCWTEKTAYKRIHQVLTIEDSYSLIMEDDENKVVGFVMGYFKQYDDILGYCLEEIIIKYNEQNKGFGRELLNEIEKRVVEKGASCIELQAVNDKMHSYFYGKAGYLNSDSFENKVKWFT